MALLMRPEPFSNEFSRLFNQFFEGQQGGAEGQRWMPAVDLAEAEDHFVLKADLPGLSEGDVAIEVHDGALTISGERRAEEQTRERGWVRVERSFGRFSRSLTLPDGVDPEAITASFDKGVLEVRIPKPEERKPRRIAIKASSAGAQQNGGEPKTVEGTASERA